MNSLPKITTQKKALVLGCLFLFVIGLMLPLTTQAAFADYCGSPGDFMYNYCHYFQKNAQTVQKGVENALGDIGKGVFTALIAAVGIIATALTSAIAVLSATFLKWVISDGFVKVCYTCFDNEAIKAGWPMVRNLANMIVVLGFVVIGIATALRFRDYEAKKLLPRLIIAALLINFSLVICGIFIDAAQITTKYFLGSSGFMQDTFIDSVAQQPKQIMDLWAAKPTEPTTILAPVVGFVFFNIMFFVVNILYFFLFMFRYMALWILVILSPLAFVLAVFPATKNFFNMWKNNFIGWCIIGIPASFFIWLSDSITKGFANPSTLSGTNASLGVFMVPGFFLILGFLFTLQISAMGSSMATKLANKTMGYAKGAGVLAGKSAIAGGKKMSGATGNKLNSWANDPNSGIMKKVAGKAGQWSGANWAMRKAGESGSMVDKAKTAMTRAGEAAGIIDPGVSAGQRDARIGKVMGSMKNITDNKKLARIAETDSGDRGVAATIILAERNALNNIDAKKRRGIVQNALSKGVSKEKFAKSPELMSKSTDNQAVDRLMQEEEARMLSTSTGKANYIGSPAKKERLERDLETYKKTILGDRAILDSKKVELDKEQTDANKLSYDPVTDKEIMKRMKDDYTPSTAEVSTLATAIRSTRRGLTMAQAEAQAYKQLKEGYDPIDDPMLAQKQLDTRKAVNKERGREKALGFEYATRDEAKEHMIDEEAKRLRAAGLTGGNHDREMRRYVGNLTERDIDTGRNAYNKEKEVKAIKKLGVGKLRELPENQIDSMLIEHSNYNTLDRAYLEFTTENKDKAKTVLPTLANKIFSGLGIPSGSNIGVIRAEINRLKNSPDPIKQKKGLEMKELVDKYILIKFN